MVRKAVLSDVEQIHKLIKNASKKGNVLPRSVLSICENIRDFFVFEVKGRVIGTCALHVVWKELAEIRSLVVLPRYRRRGIGGELVKEAIKEAKSIGIKKIFVLTNNERFFKKFNFKRVKRDSLPHKIWICLLYTSPSPRD